MARRQLLLAAILLPQAAAFLAPAPALAPALAPAQAQAPALAPAQARAPAQALASASGLASGSARGQGSKIRLSMASSVMEQYLANKEAQSFLRKEEHIKGAYEQEIRAVAAGNAEVCGPLMDKNFWRSMGVGLTISESAWDATITGSGGRIPTDCPGFSFDRVEKARQIMEVRGFTAVEDLDWQAAGVDMAAISATMNNLVENGWPPVFIFMFDEAWRMCEGLFHVMAPLLQDGKACLEPSVYGWALKPRPAGDASKSEVVGGNFGMPHRDAIYRNCHLHDGSPGILSVWIPTVDTDIENGCMYVIPREKDVFFDKCHDPAHHDPFRKGFPYQDLRPLPARAGTVLSWHPNLIHWGSSCSDFAEEPRKSIAMAFRVDPERYPYSSREQEMYQRDPFSYEEIQRGISFQERLQLCARALLMYSVWHPEFKGFDEKHLNVEL